MRFGPFRFQAILVSVFIQWRSGPLGLDGKLRQSGFEVDLWIRLPVLQIHFLLTGDMPHDD